jgi:hypothetical protein
MRISNSASGAMDSPGGQTASVAPAAVGIIQRLDVKVTAGNGPNSGTTSNLWLLISIKPLGGGQSDGAVACLGQGLAKGETKTFSISWPSASLYEKQCGGIALVNGRGGGHPDLEVQSVRIEGIDDNGKRWLIADYTIPSSQPWRRWLKDDPQNKSQGPVLPVPTLSEWQPK